MLGVNAGSQFNSWVGKPVVAGTAAAIARGLDASAWQRLSAGAGTKGARLYDWARLAECSVRRSRMEWQDEGYLELADLEADEYRSGAVGVWTRGLLIRRGIADGKQAYFTAWCPAGTGIETLGAVEGQRWVVENAFETAKTELGLDHNETRFWHGWQRHVSPVMFASRRRQPFAIAQTAHRTQGHPPSSTGRYKRSAA